MTTSRIVRGTKGRICLYICAILIVTGILAFYNNTRIELHTVQKSYELCHKQQESLSSQLQLISEYKLRLEKSLKTEKAEHEQARAELESSAKEEKLRNEKSASDATLRFNSLQQHYNLLQTQHDDFKEECSKIQREQLDEINNLQAKLKEVQGQLKQAEREKENSLGHLKSQIEQLRIEKQNNGNSNKEEVSRLQKEIHDLKVDCQLVLKNVESIPPSVYANSSDDHKPSFSKLSSDQKYPVADKHFFNVADLPSNVDEPNNFNPDQVDAPKYDKSLDNNLMNDQNVLAMPNNKIDVKSSTSNSNMKSSSKPSFNVVAPLKSPTVTPETLKVKSVGSKLSNPVPAPAPNRKIPDGVVPLHPLLPDELKVENNPKQGDTIADFVNNRYRNIVDGNKENKGQDVEPKLNDVPEKENGANEIFDFPLNEEESNISMKHPVIQKNQKQHIDSLAVVGGKDKLYEAADYDKFVQNDANLEENEEDDDADDYGNHNINKELAVRN